MPGIDIREFQYILKKCKVGLRILAVNDGMHTVDHRKIVYTLKAIKLQG